MVNESKEAYIFILTHRRRIGQDMSCREHENTCASLKIIAQSIYNSVFYYRHKMRLMYKGVSVPLKSSGKRCRSTYVIIRKIKALHCGSPCVRCKYLSNYAAVISVK